MLVPVLKFLALGIIMFSRKIKIFSLFLSLMAAGQAISAVKSPDVTVYAQKEGAGSVWNSVDRKSVV